MAGRRRCAGESVQRCGDEDRDGELAWETFRDCADRSGCTDGACTDPLQGFADEPTRWSLPTGFRPGGETGFTLLSQQRADQLFPEDWLWRTTDLTGDGRPDLVVTAELVGQGRDGRVRAFGQEGERHWKVFPGGADGFASAPVEWSLPEWGSGNESFSKVDHTAYLGPRNFPDTGGFQFWWLGNLVDGGLSTFESDDGRYWKVYEGGTEGFASSPTRWRLPDLPNDQFQNLWATDYSVSYAGRPGDTRTNRLWRTGDFDGDGYWDLAITRKVDPNEPAYEPVGDPDTPQWKVYRGGPDGFSEEAETWRLPNRAASSELFSSGQLVLEALSSGKSVAFAVTHTSGDEPDTVFGYDEDNSHWRVYDLGPDGFTEGPREWSVPTKLAGAAGGFFAWNHDPSGASEEPPDGARRWTASSMSRRPGLDLLVTAEFLDGSGVPPPRGRQPVLEAVPRRPLICVPRFVSPV